MKKIILAIATLLAVSVSSQAQYNKDGSPDMRYSVNKQTYGSSYQQSTQSNRNIYSVPIPTFTSPKMETYTTPNYGNYTQPRVERQSAIPSYPTTKSGTLDMRFKENKQIYGVPRF